MIKVSGNNPILAKSRKLYQKTSTTATEIFLISIFDLKEEWKIVFTETAKILNFPKNLVFEGETGN